MSELDQDPLDMDTDQLLALDVATRVQKALTPPAAASVIVSLAAAKALAAGSGQDWRSIAESVFKACFGAGGLPVSRLAGARLDIDASGKFQLSPGEDTDPIVSLPASRLQALLEQVYSLGMKAIVDGINSGIHQSPDKE